MADNTIVISAVDRSIVQVNGITGADREKTIVALSVGDTFVPTTTSADLKFFFDTELINDSVLGIAGFTIVAFGLFLVAFWDSPSENGAVIATGGIIVSFFAIYPYLISLTDWRNALTEEAEALMHASIGMNKCLKSVMVLFMIILVSLIEWAW